MTAAALERAGVEVRLVASDTAPRASDGSLVWLNVSSTHDPTYAALRAASMGLWHKTDAPVPWQGALLWPENEPALDLMTKLGWQSEIVNADRFTQLAPGVSDAPKGAVYFPGEGACDPVEMLRWAEARLNCARISDTVASIAPGRVSLAGGEILTAEKIIIAAGCATPALVAPLGVEISLKSAPGLFLLTSPAAAMATPVLASPGMDFWQRSDGRFVVATGASDTLRQDPKQAASEALAKVQALMPGVGDLTIEKMGVYQRPVPADGLPVVGQVADGIWAAVMHSGMTLAPIIADCVSAEVLGQPAPHDLAPYRPRQMS